MSVIANDKETREGAAHYRAVPKLMEKLCSYANSDRGDELLNPVIKAY